MEKSSSIDFRTELQKKREVRDALIYEEFEALSADSGASKMEVTKYLMDKYGVHSESTIWAIRRRMEKSLREEGAEAAGKRGEALAYGN